MDLTDAYYHIPIHPSHRKYFRFATPVGVFQYQALPMGLASSPRVFTRLIRCVKEYVQKFNVILHQYLDDWLVRARSRQIAHLHTQFIVRLVQGLGLLVNQKKSEMEPVQNIVFLGYQLRLDLGIVQPTTSRWEKIQQVLSPFLQNRSLPAVRWQQALGLLTSTEKLVPLGLLHTRPMQWGLLDQWSPFTGDPLQDIVISQHVQETVFWWLQESHVMRGIPFRIPDPDIHIFTDASPRGWGGHLEGKEVGGPWTSQEEDLHINVQELLAVQRTLHQFQGLVQGRSVLIASDNTTAVAYLQNQGGTRSWPLMQIAREIFLWLDRHRVTMRCRHIPGRFNVHADRLSRAGEVIPTEWSLHPRIVESLWSHWDRPNIDLFATRWNNKLPVYVSPVPDAAAYAVDAMSLPWQGIYGYAFPPTAILHKVLTKLAQEECCLVMITPLWPRQGWYPALLDLLIDVPIHLPPIQKMLKQPQSSLYHRDPECFHLHAWLLSPNVLRRKGFLERLPSEWRKLRRNQVCQCTSPNGIVSKIGALNGVQIPCKPLWD